MYVQGIFFLVAIFILTLLVVQRFIKARQLKSDLDSANFSLEDSQNAIKAIQDQLLEKESAFNELNTKLAALSVK